MKAAINIPPFRNSDKKRFWGKIQRVPGGRCWNWTAGLSSAGYGKFAVRKGIILYAHRIAWFLSTSKDPGAKEVCHKCDNPKCCRPTHLFIGTRGDNVRDMVAKNRHFLGIYNRMTTGELSHRSVATMSQVQEMRGIYAEGERTIKEIARQFGLSISGTGHILRRHTWKHVA